MALGTVTLVGKQAIMGEMGYSICDVQLSSGANYTTNGSAFDIGQVPGAASGTLIAVIPCGTGGSVGANGATVRWDQVNKKLQAFGTAGSASGLTEIANGTDLSAQVVRVLCLYTAVK